MRNNKHELLLPKILKSVDCIVLKYGSQKSNMEFYYCNCDPYQKDPICKECSIVCHKGHTLTSAKYGFNICNCGINCHKVYKMDDSNYDNYVNKCFFSEWSKISRKNIYYTYSGETLCIFCKNFCKDIYKTHEILKVENKDKNPACNCVHTNHQHLIKILSKINRLMYLYEYDFEDFTHLQILNLICLSPNSFNNNYNNFTISFNILHKKLQDPDFVLDVHFDLSHIAHGMKNFTTLTNPTKFFYYFCQKIKSFFSLEFLDLLLKKTCDESLVNLWIFKNNVVSNFRKIIILSDFMFCPSIKVRDMLNLNPLMRMTICSNIKEDERVGKYLKKQNGVSCIDSVIYYLYKLNLINEKKVEIYGLFKSLFSICKVFVKYNMLDYIQTCRICAIIDQVVISFLLEKKKLSKLSSKVKDDLIDEYNEHHTEIMLPIIKTLYYIVFYYNDKQVTQHVNKEIHIDQVNFFHKSNELGRLVNKNCINILNFSKIYYENKDTKGESSITLGRKAKSYMKKLKKIVNYSIRLISFTLNYPDHYIMNLRTLINSNNSIYLKYLEGNLNNKELEFVKFLKSESTILERNYQDFFEMKISINDIKNRVQISIKNFFNFISNSEYYPSKTKNKHTADLLHLNEKNIIVSEKENKSKFKVYPKNTLDLDRKATTNQNKDIILCEIYRILMNKSFYVTTIIKFIKLVVVFERNKTKQDIVASLSKVDFDENIISDIIKLLYYYSDDNPDNCMIIFSSEFVYTFNSLRKNNYESLNDLYVNCLQTLRRYNYKFSNNHTIFVIIQNLINELKTDEDNFRKMLPSLLKLLKYYFQIPLIENDKQQKKMKSFLKSIYNDHKLLGELKNLIIEKAKKYSKQYLHIGFNNNIKSLKTFSDVADYKFKPNNVDESDQLLLYNIRNNLNSEESKKDEGPLGLNVQIKIAEDKIEKNLIRSINEKSSFTSKKGKPPLPKNSTFNVTKKKNTEKISKKLSEKDEEMSLNKGESSGTNKINNQDKLFADINHEEENQFTDKTKIYLLFLKLVNKCYENNSSAEDIEFLKTLLTSKEIIIILKNVDLKIKLRMEILKFHRLVYMNDILENSNLNKNKYFLFSLVTRKGFNDVIEDKKLFEDIFAKSFQVNQIIPNFLIIRHEIKYFFDVILNNELDSDAIITYIEDGILLSLLKFLRGFLAFLEDHKGYYCLVLYEILFYLLQLKKFIFQNKAIFQKNVEIEKKDYFGDINFKFSSERRYYILSSKLSSQDYEELEKDINMITNPNFELFNCKLILAKIEKHIFCFTSKAESKSIIEFFRKKNEKYSELKLIKLRKKLIEGNFLQTDYEKSIFNLIIKYENEKHRLDDCHLFKILSEIDSQLQSNYGYLMLRFFFQIMFRESKHHNLIYYNILRLLQFDTDQCQKDIRRISKIPVFNFNILIDQLFKNLTQLILNNFDPSSNKMNENYFTAVNIIKIFKFLCEEHNNYFQKLFLIGIKIDCRKEKFTESKIYLNNYERVNEISLFDFLLNMLTKITILSKWDKVDFHTNENNINYFLDIFVSVLELLIEIIQGNKKKYLERLLVPFFFNEKSEDQTSIKIFLKTVKTIVLRDKNDSLSIYVVRKFIMEFIVAILEEKSAPEKLKMIISRIYYPFSLINTILNTMKKLFIKYHMEEEKVNNKLMNKSYENEEKERLLNYKKLEFDRKIYDFFKFKFFNDEKFKNIPEFELSNKMYHYLKLLAEEYEHPEAILITEVCDKISENEIIKYSKGNSKNDVNEVFINKFKKFYYCVKFFEHITRMVFIYKDKDNSTVRQPFTINPLMIYLSKISMFNFENNVIRQNRFTKVTEMLEHSQYFYEEINYNHRISKNGSLFSFFIQIDYSIMEKISFLITSIINFFMFKSLSRVDFPGEVEDNHHRNLSGKLFAFQGTLHFVNWSWGEGNEVYTDIIIILSVVQIILNLVIILIWFINKFPLNYIIEQKKYCHTNLLKLNKLSFTQKIYIIIFPAIVYRNEINVFLWNLILSVLGITNVNRIFLFSLQVLSIINLSENLKNIIMAIIVKPNQLLLTFLFLILAQFCFASSAFFKLNDDHYFSLLPTNERFCGSYYQCFLNTVYLGIRGEGGIGNFMHDLSLTNDGLKSYLKLFFFTILFRVSMLILEEIFFGSVIDNYSELREKSLIQDNDIRNICFICGGERDELEKKSINFDKHREKVHNLWNYVEFIVSLKFEDIQEANATKSYVMKMIENNNIIWIPSFKKTNE